MLSVVLTDATVDPATLHGLLRPAAARTWDQLSVDGDTSHERHGLRPRVRARPAPRRCRRARARRSTLGRAIEAVARDLARQQAADGEGATTLITCQVSGATDDADARAVARAVISSSLVKAAVHGTRPELGPDRRRRGQCDARRRGGPGGGAGWRRRPRGHGPGPPATLDPARLRIAIAGHLVFDGPAGGPIAFDRDGGPGGDGGPGAADPARPRASATGTGEAFGCDLTEEYVIENSRVHDVSEILVVKLGGTTIADQAQVLDEVAAVARRRPVVLVHGGGKRITEWLDRMGVPSRFENGLRVTDQAALEVAAAVLRGVVNSELVAGLRDRGVDAVGLSGVDGGLLISERVAGHRARRPCRRPAPRPPRRDPRRRPGARSSRRSPATRTGSSATSTPTTRRPGSRPGLGARQLVLMTDVDGVRDADGRRLDTLTSRRGRDPDRQRRDRRRDGPEDPGRPRGPRLGRLRGDHRRLVRRRALERALDDPTFGTRITAGSVRRSGRPDRCRAGTRR